MAKPTNSKAEGLIPSLQSRLDSLSEAIALNEKLCQNSPQAVRDFYRNQIKYLTEQYRAVLKEMEE